jgi:hypothetical protein
MASLRRLVFSTGGHRRHQITYHLLCGYKHRHKSKAVHPRARGIHDKPTSDDGKNPTTGTAQPEPITSHFAPNGSLLQEKTALLNVSGTDAPGDGGNPEEGDKRSFRLSSSPMSDAILTTAIGIGIGE